MMDDPTEYYQMQYMRNMTQNLPQWDELPTKLNAL